jgi:DNA-binding transcriptional MerR regulator
MASYSIKDLERLTDIKAHTIRIWEKRYKIISPSRTETNIRYYSDDQLKHLLKVVILYNAGMKISKIVKLSADLLNIEVQTHLSKENDFEPHITQLVACMLKLDEKDFLKELTSLSKKFGFEEVMLKVIYPLMEKIGILWQTDKVSPAQEHFLSNLTRQKLIAEIDKTPLIPAKKKEDIFILYLPEHELHEMGLLFAYFLLKKHEQQVIYLGQSVPVLSLIDVLKETGAKRLLSAWVGACSDHTINKHFKTINESGINVDQFTIGGRTIKTAPPANVRQLLNIGELNNILPN